jgi:hypothetical protein
MKKRKPRRVKSKVFNYEVADRNRRPGSGRWIHGMIVLVLIAVAAGIAYVWQRNLMLNMGYTVSKLQHQKAALDAEQVKLDADISTLKEPNRLRREVEQRHLGLRQPTPEQIVRVPEPEPLKLVEDEQHRLPLGQRLWDSIVLGER